MSDDIFSNWKKNKFVLVDFELLAEPEIIIVLTDLTFWVNHADELTNWCAIHGGAIHGLTVQFNTEEQLTLFTLRWS